MKATGPGQLSRMEATSFLCAFGLVCALLTHCSCALRCVELSLNWFYVMLQQLSAAEEILPESNLQHPGKGWLEVIEVETDKQQDSPSRCFSPKP